MLGYVYYFENLVLFLKPFDPKKKVEQGGEYQHFLLKKKFFIHLNFPH